MLIFIATFITSIYEITTSMTYSLFTVMPTLVILFWLIHLLIDVEKNNVKRFSIFFLSIAFVNFIIQWFYFNHNYELFPILDSILTFTALSLLPLYYIYIRLLTTDAKIDFKWTWILIPSIMLSLFSAINYIMMSPQEIEIYKNEILYHKGLQSGSFSPHIELQILKNIIFKIVYIVQVILSVILGVRIIYKLNKRLQASYSDVKKKELLYLKWTFYLFILSSIISTFYSIIGINMIVDNTYLMAIPAIAYSFTFYGICYLGYRLSFTMSDFTEDELRSEGKHNEDMKPVISLKRQAEFYNKLESLVQEEQIFKDPEFRLNDLAAKLGTNRTYASQLIKNKSNANFNEYINRHRIIYAKNILSLESKNHLTLDEIALKAGFASQSSFYRAFLKVEGTTPGKYRMEQTERKLLL